MNVDRLRNALRPLDLSVPFSPTAEECQYLDFYDIHFQQAIDSVDQYMGYLDSGEFKPPPMTLPKQVRSGLTP